MMITIEQAVEAVRTAIPDAGDIWQDPIDGVHAMRMAAIAALRALPPAEATEEEVERVARAVYTEDEVMECLTPESRVPWDALTDDWRNHWRTVARAAIAAMRGER